MSFKKEKDQIIFWAHQLYEKNLTKAKSGNISLKVEKDKILITAHDTFLGYLEKQDIILMDLEGNILEGEKEVTSEKLIHLSIHKKFPQKKAVLHAHPPFTVAFFHYFKKLNNIFLESKYYLKNIKVITQKTINITKVKPVLSALAESSIVVIKDHGVISIGDNFKEAFGLIELVEEQARINFFMKLLNKDG